MRPGCCTSDMGYPRSWPPASIRWERCWSGWWSKRRLCSKGRSRERPILCAEPIQLELDMESQAEVYQAGKKGARSVSRCGRWGELAMGLHARVMGRLSVLLLLGAGLLPAVSAQGASPDPAPLADMRHIKKFVLVEVLTQGTAEKIGI